jgi:hypothetical protein
MKTRKQYVKPQVRKYGDIRKLTRHTNSRHGNDSTSGTSPNGVDTIWTGV